MNDDEIRKQNRDDLLERMSESGNAHSSDYPYGLMMEAEEEIKRLRAENDTLRRERDEARREVCLEASTDASGCYISGRHILVAENRGWDCFKQEPLPLKRKTKKEYDPRVISLEELERTTRNLRMND